MNDLLKKLQIAASEAEQHAGGYVCVSSGKPTATRAVCSVAELIEYINRLRQMACIGQSVHECKVVDPLEAVECE